jgi:hypothetical protein
MSNAIKIQLLTAVAMTVAATPQHASDMAGSVEGDVGFEITNPDGTTSWLSETVYLATHQSFDKLSFAQAIHLVGQGYSVANTDWNTFFKYIKLGTTLPVLPPLSELDDGTHTEYPADMIEATTKPYYDITTEGGIVMHNWIPSHVDIQSTTWYVWTQEAADSGLAEWQADFPGVDYIY